MAEPITREPTPPSDNSEVKAPEGTVEAERAGYVSELIAYRVVDHVAVAIANRVKKFMDSATSRVLLVDDPQFASGGTALNEIRGQISIIESAFGQCERENKRLLADEPSEEDGQAEALGFFPTLTAGLAFLPEIAKGAGAVADVLSYFR